jgi:hypothetical protein
VRAFFLSLVSSIGRFGKYMEKNLWDYHYQEIFQFHFSNFILIKGP